jgi:hypothetical protein
MRTFIKQLAARIERARPAMQPVGVSMASQLDSAKLAEIAEHVSKLASLGLEVISFDTIDGELVFRVRTEPLKLARLGYEVLSYLDIALAPSFTVRPTTLPAPKQAGYTVQEF